MTAIAQVDLDPSSPTYQQLINILITSHGSGYLSNDALNITLLGGGVIEGMPHLFPIVDRELRRRALAAAAEHARLVLPALGGH